MRHHTTGFNSDVILCNLELFDVDIHRHRSILPSVSQCIGVAQC